MTREFDPEVMAIVNEVDVEETVINPYAAELAAFEAMCWGATYTVAEAARTGMSRKAIEDALEIKHP